MNETDATNTRPMKSYFSTPEKAEFVSDHLRIEERSIMLHRAVAERIRANPNLLETARKNLKRYFLQYASMNKRVPAWALEWRAILEGKTVQEILEFMVSPEEKARQLRQSSPFAGILTPKERWNLYEAYGAGAYYSGSRKHRR